MRLTEWCSTMLEIVRSVSQSVLRNFSADRRSTCSPSCATPLLLSSPRTGLEELAQELVRVFLPPDPQVPAKFCAAGEVREIRYPGILKTSEAAPLLPSQVEPPFLDAKYKRCPRGTPWYFDALDDILDLCGPVGKTVIAKC